MLHTYEEYKMLIEKRAVGIEDYVKQIINLLVDAGAPRELVSDDKTKQCIREQFSRQRDARDKYNDGSGYTKDMKFSKSDRIAKDFEFELFGMSSFYLRDVPLLGKWGVSTVHFYTLDDSKYQLCKFKDVIRKFTSGSDIRVNFPDGLTQEDMLEKYGEKRVRVSVQYEDSQFVTAVIFDDCVLYYDGQSKDFGFMTLDDVKKNGGIFTKTDAYWFSYYKDVCDKMSKYTQLFNSTQSGVDKLQAKQDLKDNGE